MADVIVAGGGVMGLACARELALAGREVLLLEKGRTGSGATWASAGIVSTHGTAGRADRGGEAGLRLRRASFPLWPGFARALQEESGLDPEFRETGVLLLALDEGQARELQAEPGTHALGEGRWLGAAELREAEPALSDRLPGALLLPGGSVDPRKLAPALALACRRLGVEIREGQLVRELLVEGGRARGVRTLDGEAGAPAVLVCAGVGSRELPGLAPAPPILPQRGQILSLDARGIGPRRVLITPEDPYFVPRADGRLVLGATRELAGEDPRLTAGGLAWLLTSGIRVIPALAHAPIEETWTGFRPLSADGLPLIGPGRLEGLFFCAGHGPTGIGPAPASARLAAALLLGEAPPLDPAPYDPRRFG
ncbi:MAG: FAD-dependent oxidoreductase [Candidatus Tectomicrobia bacterium]|uniref:FAD-dependent oxidoreductase n=1 Tax=Tectimicrobiota bacterium TaxID=2528274 RepID=A0A932I1J5_UNCTE|nr:FAD-dependent oxidoreductase [Candidatus Tectomicrobia bacterium]